MAMTECPNCHYHFFTSKAKQAVIEKLRQGPVEESVLITELLTVLSSKSAAYPVLKELTHRGFIIKNLLSDHYKLNDSVLISK